MARRPLADFGNQDSAHSGTPSINLLKAHPPEQAASGVMARLFAIRNDSRFLLAGHVFRVEQLVELRLRQEPFLQHQVINPFISCQCLASQL